MPELVAPSERWQAAFVGMAAECSASGDTRYDLALADFHAYLRTVEDRRTRPQPPGWVNSAEYWLEDSGDIVGCVRIRFALTPALEAEGGHVGYDVRPSMRRKGYGTELLRLALPLLRAHGVTRVRITCNDDNTGSARIIERNGGVLSGHTRSPATGKTVRQYWIDLRSPTRQ